jgi:hypothetical protein
MQQIVRIIALGLFLLGLNGCAVVTKHDGADATRVHLEHAGEPVNRVFIGGGIRDWQPVGADMVRMEFNRQRHFLVELAPPCPGALRGAATLQLVPAQHAYLSTFDQVRIDGLECRIQTIRELDYESVREALKQ